jgi:hypothetical protein
LRHFEHLVPDKAARGPALRIRHRRAGRGQAAAHARLVAPGGVIGGLSSALTSEILITRGT